MKNKLVFLLISALVAASASHVHAAHEAIHFGKTATKVGIAGDELTNAIVLSYRTGHEELLQTLLDVCNDLEGFSMPRLGGSILKRRFTEAEINNILWPLLVWAIENDHRNVFENLIFIIGDQAKKPYGRPTTPQEIAAFHKSKNILGWFAYKNRMSGDFLPAVPKKQDLAKAPWSHFAQFVELGDVRGVESILDQDLIGINDIRNEPGVRSHGKTMTDIAIFNTEKGGGVGQKEILELLRSRGGMTRKELDRGLVGHAPVEYGAQWLPGSLSGKWADVPH